MINSNCGALARILNRQPDALAKQTCKNLIFAFHIHSGANCSGNEADEFANVNGHFNPQNTPHPCHAGDMPPLFDAGGRAFSAFLTDRFTLPEIIGRTVIIHNMPDDFTSQPSGNAGEKIACGVISKRKKEWKRTIC